MKVLVFKVTLSLGYLGCCRGRDPCNICLKRNCLSRSMKTANGPCVQINTSFMIIAQVPLPGLGLGVWGLGDRVATPCLHEYHMVSCDLFQAV